jgi:hypothetical protein
MHHATNTVYITIKNDPKALERIFEGMFVVARRLLGFSPKGSSYPFTTAVLSPTFREFDKHLSQYKSACAVILDKYQGARTDKPCLLAVTGTGGNETNKNGVIGKVFHELRELECFEWEDINFLKNHCNGNDLTGAFFADYWADMLAFAKINRYYDRQWQSIPIGHCN